jgi:hypothetical protein
MKTIELMNSVKAKLVEVQNQNNRIEAKLDALISEAGVEDEVELPEEIKAPKMSGEPELPHNVKMQEKVSTLELPGSPDNREVPTGDPQQPELRAKDTTPLPSAVTGTPSDLASPLYTLNPAEEPWKGYDQMTVGDILKKLKSDKPKKKDIDRVLAYERAHQQRTTLVEALVNWNS